MGSPLHPALTAGVAAGTLETRALPAAAAGQFLAIRSVAGGVAVVGPDPLAAVAVSGDYADLTGRPALGTAAAADAGDFDPAGSAAAVAGDLSAHAAATTAAHGGIVAAGDPRLSDARAPLAHAHAADDVTSGVFDAARLPPGGWAGFAGDVTATQALAAGAWTTVSLTTVHNTTAGAGSFVAPRAGLYLISAAAQFSRPNTTVTFLQVGYRVNGGADVSVGRDTVQGVTGGVAAHGTRAVALAAGDSVDFRAVASNAADVVDGSFSVLIPA